MIDKETLEYLRGLSPETFINQILEQTFAQKFLENKMAKKKQFSIFGILDR